MMPTAGDICTFIYYLFIYICMYLCVYVYVYLGRAYGPQAAFIFTYIYLYK
jgi:hypothetical protein